MIFLFLTAHNVFRKTRLKGEQMDLGRKKCSVKYVTLERSG